MPEKLSKIKQHAPEQENIQEDNVESNLEVSGIKHIPVMVKEVLEGLNIRPGKTYLDVTFGGGGHTRAILESDPTVKVIALDWDMKALEAGEKLQEEFPGRLSFIWGSFGHLYKLLKKQNIQTVDGILADFGTSFMQIHEQDGFSVYNDTPLDMRMSSAHFKVTAAEIIRFSTERELCEIFWEFGEERFARQIVREIIRTRETHFIRTTKDLADIIERSVGRIYRAKKQKIHPATRVFQALRIFVNKELDNIISFLPIAVNSLAPQARMVCISFHSGEDRLVKHFFKEEAQKGLVTLVSRRAIVATEEETKENPSSRSAKLRVIEKK